MLQFALDFHLLLGDAIFLTIKDNLSNQLHQHLGFALTNAQQRSIADINADLSSNHPMLRLLQGDVGSGKFCDPVRNAISIPKGLR
jgi:RecG-like helicase